MGFSLTFARVAPDRTVDPDRPGIAAFLAARGISLGPAQYGTADLHGADGARLTLDGSVTDLHMSPLDAAGEFAAGIFHATLGPEECDFVYDLCLAGRMLVINHQGSPLLVVPGGTHAPADLPPEVDEVAWVAGGAELREALVDGFARFRAYRDAVIG